MATVNIVLSRMWGVSMCGTNLPVIDGNAKSAQSLTSSGTSQASTPVSADPQRGAYNIMRITSSGGNVWAKFGSSPTAAAGSDWLLVDGVSYDFVVRPGDKVAIIDA